MVVALAGGGGGLRNKKIGCAILTNPGVQEEGYGPLVC
jgi:hypothetical protein